MKKEYTKSFYSHFPSGYLASQNKRKAKEESKTFTKNQSMMRDEVYMSVESEVNQKRKVNNIEHFVVNYASDKSKHERFRNSLHLSNQTTDFDFKSSTDVIAIDKAGRLKTYDFLSAEVQNVNATLFSGLFAQLQLSRGFKLVPTSLVDQAIEDENFQSILNSQRRDYLIHDQQKISFYDSRKNIIKEVASTTITEYTSICLESQSGLDFSASKFLNQDGGTV